jgi:hypothetical protein
MEFWQAIHNHPNIEIISKLLNSIAKKYHCSIKYEKFDHVIHFHGNKSYQHQIIEEFLSLFPKIQRDLVGTVQNTPIQKSMNPMALYEKRDAILKIEDLLALPEHLPTNLIEELKKARNQLIWDLKGSFLLPKSFFSEKHSCLSWLEGEE